MHLLEDGLELRIEIHGAGFPILAGTAFANRYLGGIELGGGSDPELLAVPIHMIPTECQGLIDAAAGVSQDSEEIAELDSVLCDGSAVLLEGIALF